MKNITNSCLIQLILLILSCNSDKGYQITANIYGLPDTIMIYLKNDYYDSINDSTLAINGTRNSIERLKQNNLIE